MFSFDSGSPLPIPDGERCWGLAFDGCRYVLTIRCACLIAVLDRRLCYVKTIKTRRPYTAICYDPKRDCFWAASDQCRSALFRLDPCFQEIDRLMPRLDGCCVGLFTGLSCCCGSGRLLAACGNRLLEIDPDDGAARLLWEEQGSVCILTVVCAAPYLILNVLRGCTAYISLLSWDGTVLEEEEAPGALAVDDLLLIPSGQDEWELLLLADKRGCYPHLFRARLDLDLCPCNRELCRTCGNGKPDACGVLESIAREEAAVAHILNAEGEKLQAVIARACSIRELMDVNESVRRTLLHVTQLEQVLLSKAEVVCCQQHEAHGEQSFIIPKSLK